jgi:hypothetical protein
MNRLSAILAITSLFTAAAVADVITLRNGQIINGTYLGGTARTIRVDAGGQIQTFDIGQVQSISFNDAGAQPQASQNPGYSRGGQYNSGPAYPPPGSYPAPGPVAAAPQPSAAGASGITIPADTRVTIRMIDSVDSDTARLGQTFKASLDEPLEVNGQVVAPRGADVSTKLVRDEQSGKIEGRTVLTLALASITINGQPVDVTSTDVTQESASRGSKSAKVIGGTAALGTIIGAGGAVQVFTSGQKVKIPSETRLTFRLQSPVQL